MTIRLTKTAGVTLAGALVLGASAAAGQDSMPQVTTSRDLPVAYVSYADLNLGHTRGLEVLNRRIARAAERVCGMAGHYQSLQFKMRDQACFHQAVASAQPQIESAIRLAAITPGKLATIALTAQ